MLSSGGTKIDRQRVGRFPFEGIRIIEITNAVAGPIAAKLFADYGAQVITVESTRRLVETGTPWQPPAKVKDGDRTGFNLRPLQNKFNTNKLSLTLDLTKPEAILIIKKLLAVSDILIHNFSPQTLERWGLTYDDLVMVKPDIIMISMPGMGRGGPYSNYRAWGWNLWALAGFHYLSGYPDKPPICPAPVSWNDMSCNAFHSIVAILAALYHKDRTGKGQLIEVSQLESTVCVSDTSIFRYLVNGHMPERMGNHSDYAAPHGVYRCSGNNRWCAIAVFTDEEWKALCQVIGNEELIQDRRFSTILGRLNFADELDLIIEEWTQQKTAEEVMRLVQEAGVAAGAVQNVEDVLIHDPQLKERRHWVNVEHPEAGKITLEGWGFKLSAVADQLWERPPLLGEHNDYILGEILGIPEEKVNELIVNEVIY